MEESQDAFETLKKIYPEAPVLFSQAISPGNSGLGAVLSQNRLTGNTIWQQMQANL